MTGKKTIRQCGPDDHQTILGVINAAAEAYRGVIPADRWHDPYMTAEYLASEVGDGVVFHGRVAEGGLVGVMGVQRRSNVDLIRHAYVLPGWQGRGIGSDLIADLCGRRERPMLVGTWRAATWAVRFYERHGFTLVGDADVAILLRTYWDVPERQVATSVVLASPALTSEAAERLTAAAG